MQADAYLQKLDPVIQRLQEDIPQAKYERRNLGHLVAQLLQFQEDALGVNVSLRRMTFQLRHTLLSMICC